jgi:hypothetical protein
VDVGLERIHQAIHISVEHLRVFEAFEVEPLERAGDDCGIDRAKLNRSQTLAARGSEFNLSLADVRGHRIRAEHKNHRVGLHDQILNALPPILEDVNVAAVDQRLEAAVLQLTVQPIGEGHVLPAVGDEDLGLGLPGLSGRIVRHQRAPRAGLIFITARQDRQAPPDLSVAAVVVGAGQGVQPIRRMNEISCSRQACAAQQKPIVQ